MSKNINKNQLIAAELLATGMKSKEVANKLSVSPETICRWKNNNDFNKMIDHFSKQILHELLEEQTYIYALSLQAIKEVLEDVNYDKFKKCQIAIKYINSIKHQNMINSTLKDKIFNFGII